MEFYALTRHELFFIETQGDLVSAVQVMEWSDRQELRGKNLCENHPMLFIGKVIAAYSPGENNRNPSKVSAWGPMSSDFVALFESREKAQGAFDTRVGPGRIPVEWTESTKQVISSLGLACEKIRIALDPKTGTYEVPFAG